MSSENLLDFSRGSVTDVEPTKVKQLVLKTVLGDAAAGTAAINLPSLVQLLGILMTCNMALNQTSANCEILLKVTSSRFNLETTHS